VLRIFTFVGLVYGPAVLICGSILAVPPSSAPASARASGARGLWRDRRFWPLVIGVFCGTYPGLTVIGNLKPLGLSYGLPTAAAALAISALAVGNVSGRILWGAVQDRIGPRPASLLSLASIALSLLALLVGRGNTTAFLAESVFAGFCYGGSLSLYAAQTAAVYGAERVGTVYSLVMLSHGAAALLAPAAGGIGFDLTGSFAAPILLASATACTGFAGYAILARER
jgi:MFS transporter, OFA family, oxalate/formate antiporter